MKITVETEEGSFELDLDHTVLYGKVKDDNQVFIKVKFNDLSTTDFFYEVIRNSKKERRRLVAVVEFLTILMEEIEREAKIKAREEEKFEPLSDLVKRKIHELKTHFK